MAFCTYMMTSVRQRRCHRGRESWSFVTKWGCRISRERFDLDSPSFTPTFTPVYNHTRYNITIYFMSEVIEFKKRSKMPPVVASLSRITKFHSDLPYICIEYDVTIYSRSEVTAKKPQKCRLRRFQVDFLEKNLSKDHQISHGCLEQLAPQICRIWRH